MWLRMRVAQNLRDMEADFGIIPVPKYDEAQQQYYDLQEEDPELAEDFAKKVNKRFDEKGIKRILTEKDEQEAEEVEL